jgi:AraC-like DNA-binding protein
LFNHAHISLTRQGPSVAVGLNALGGSPAHEDTVDACFALLSRMACRMAGPRAAPAMVSLRRAQPSGVEAYTSAFGHVAFSQPADRCVFAAPALHAPITQADPMVRTLLRPYAERRTQHRNRPWAAAVTDLLAAELGSLPSVAQSLMVSTRTLQSRLAGEDRTFAGLRDTFQRDLALAMLAQLDLPITTIAARVGFATPSAFTRAVRRWTGVTPSQYRDSTTP